MRKSSKTSVITTCAVISIAVICFSMILMKRTGVTEREGIPVKSMKSWQRADAPLGFPQKNKKIAKFDSRFIELSAFERLAIPTSTKASYAMGSTHGALTYNAQDFWNLNKRRGGHHTGDDLNGIGGMNSDLGDPVYAMCNGYVIYRGEPSLGWGKTLLIAHKDSEGNIYNTMYSHLDKSYAPSSQLICQGETIGTVGTANDNYPAHLHLELRSSTGVHIGSGYRFHKGECLPPKSLVTPEGKTGTDIIHSNLLSIILRQQLEDRQPIIRLNSSH